MVRIDGADRHLALQQLRQLGDGLERLVLDRGLRQAADVRRRDDARVADERRRRHLVGGAADVERGAAEVAGVERGERAPRRRRARRARH